jgi:hypothetical protein
MFFSNQMVFGRSKPVLIYERFELNFGHIWIFLVDDFTIFTNLDCLRKNPMVASEPGANPGLWGTRIRPREGGCDEGSG